jgi:hypothetical protein
MICTECNATIADKAIVCYRCGAPTASPMASRPVRAAENRRAPVAAIVSTIATVALGWFSIESDPGTTERIAAAAGAIATGIGGGYLIVRRWF